MADWDSEKDGPEPSVTREDVSDFIDRMDMVIVTRYASGKREVTWTCDDDIALGLLSWAQFDLNNQRYEAEEILREIEQDELEDADLDEDAEIGEEDE